MKYKRAPAGVVSIVPNNDSDLIKWRHDVFKPVKHTKKGLQRLTDVKNHPWFFEEFYDSWRVLCVEHPGHLKRANQIDIRYRILWGLFCNHIDKPTHYTAMDQTGWYLNDVDLCAPSLSNKVSKRSDPIVNERAFIGLVGGIQGVTSLHRNIKIVAADRVHFRFMDGFFKVGKFHVIVEYKQASGYIKPGQIEDYVRLIKRIGYGYKRIKKLMVFHRPNDDGYADSYKCDEETGIERITRLAEREAL